MPAPHHSVFYRLDALPATQPKASKHWRQVLQCFQIQSNLVISNSVNSISAYIEVRLWSGPWVIIKGRESIRFIEHGYIEFPAISSKQRHWKHLQSSFISHVGGHGCRLPGQLVKCDTCHHYQVVNPRPAGDGVTSPRLPLSPAGCCICLRVLQQQPVDFPLSEPDERQRSLMKQLGSVNSSSGLTLVAELEQLIHPSRSTHQATITDYFSARLN